MKRTTFLLLSLSVTACQQAPPTDHANTVPTATPFDACRALLGSWTDTSDTMMLFTETWQALDDSTLAGTGVGMRAGDTAFAEALRLQRVGGSVDYIAIAMGQNEDKPVAFRATQLSADSLVFENPAHDFPQRISYRKTRNGWDVSVSAVINDSNIVQTFRLRK